ncbi:uncharacterized protein METZ01_LOCUS394687, partial [marine metagenome]
WHIISLNPLAVSLYRFKEPTSVYPFYLMDEDKSRIKNIIFIRVLQITIFIKFGLYYHQNIESDYYTHFGGCGFQNVKTTQFC